MFDEYCNPHSSTIAVAIVIFTSQTTVKDQAVHHPYHYYYPSIIAKHFNTAKCCHCSIIMQNVIVIVLAFAFVVVIAGGRGCCLGWYEWLHWHGRDCCWN